MKDKDEGEPLGPRGSLKGIERRCSVEERTWRWHAGGPSRRLSLEEEASPERQGGCPPSLESGNPAVESVPPGAPPLRLLLTSGNTWVVEELA